MQHETRLGLVRSRWLCTVPVPAGGSTAAASAAPAASASTKDTRPWPVQYWKSMLFCSVVSTWVYSLWVSNRTNRLRDEMVANVRDSAPANPDELLELRALNDLPTSVVAGLPAAAASHGCAERMSGTQILQLLRQCGGGVLHDGYILERLLMAAAAAEPGDPEVAAKGATAGTAEVDVRLATASLMFLSSGPVRLRVWCGPIMDLCC